MPEEAHTELATRVSNALTGLKKGLLNKVTTLLEALPAHEKDKVLGLITKVGTPAHRAWVMNRLGDNRPGLMARYEELAAQADDQAVDALLTDVKTWAQWLRDARNAIGHVNTGTLARKFLTRTHGTTSSALPGRCFTWSSSPNWGSPQRLNGGSSTTNGTTLRSDSDLPCAIVSRRRSERFIRPIAARIHECKTG